jgi:hypothetical protein
MGVCRLGQGVQWVHWRGFRGDDQGLTKVNRFDLADLTIRVNDAN